MTGYVWRDLVRNPRRSLAALVGIMLGVGLASGLLFFDTGSGATLTRRAIAPLALDLQALLEQPLGRALRLEEQFEPLAGGAEVLATITLTNTGDAPANEVVVNAEPPAPLQYVPGTTTIDGRAVADVGSDSVLAQGEARTGHNLGTLEPGQRVVIGYRASGEGPLPRSELASQARVSTREDVVPRPANQPPPLTQQELRDRIRELPGVAAADSLSFVDLPPGALAGSAGTAPGPVRVYAFDSGYRQRYPSIRLAAGRFAEGGAVVSAEVAREVATGLGDGIRLAVPGDPEPLRLDVTGVADLADAKPLFYSRKTSKLEDFLYVPLVVVVSPSLFGERIIPAFRAANAVEGEVAKRRPVSEVDVLVDRGRLDADPARALDLTRQIAGSVERIAPDQTQVIDNISNALEVASEDAAVGRRMFVFLGLPGILLAVFLTAYAGSILAATQRREQAMLRLRGADASRLLRMLVMKAVALAVVGSLLGTAIGFSSAAVVLGGAELAAADPLDLALGAVAALLAGIVTTAVALCLPGVRSLRREVAQERRELAVDPAPLWRRWRLDLALVALALGSEAVAFLTGAFDPPPVSVSEGRAASLPSRLLIAPLGAWAGGTLLAVRLVRGVAAKVPVPAGGFGPVLWGTWSRSLRRRSWSLATGSVGVGLVTAFGVALAIFAATYDATKAADARFTVGSDLRASPSVLSLPRPTSDAEKLLVPGVRAATPVVGVPENAVLYAAFNQDRRDLAAIDPLGYRSVIDQGEASFVDAAADDVLGRLAVTPNGVLVDAETADEFHIDVGDGVDVLLARGTDQQSLQTLYAVGIFERLPGFPLGIDLVVGLRPYQKATGLTDADFFLVQTREGTDRAAALVEQAISAGPGSEQPFRIQTVRTALNKDQSSLSALNVSGLVDLDSVFVALLAAAAVGTFVFGLLLHRRREFVSLRARGVGSREILVLVLAESLVVAIAGVVAAAAVGTAMGWTLVHVLRPLFLLDPTPTVSTGRLLWLLLLPLVTSVAAAVAATAALQRMPATEVLREL